jgi:hypothetical protein
VRLLGRIPVRWWRHDPVMAQEVVAPDLGTIPSPAGSGELLPVDEWSRRDG